MMNGTVQYILTMSRWGRYLGKGQGRWELEVEMSSGRFHDGRESTIYI